MGLFDPVKKILDPHIWEKGKLRPEVRLFILQRLTDLTSIQPVRFIRIDLIGSIGTYQYSESSDIDVQVTLAPEYDEDEDFWHQVFKATDGFFLPGTIHPITYFVLPSITVKYFTGEGLTSGYNLITDTWIKKAKKPTYAELHKFDIDKPIFELTGRAMRQQLEQYQQRPTLDELRDVAEMYQRRDLARKSSYTHPGLQAGSKSYANALYKYLERLFGEKLEKLYHQYYDPIREMREKL